MDSFFSLFDPSDGQAKPKKKNTQNIPDNVKKKDAPKGRRRGGGGWRAGQSLPEQCSFLCEPELGEDLLVQNGSYVDDYAEVEVESQQDIDIIKPKRRNSRKMRRKKIRPSPTKDSLSNEGDNECKDSLNNNCFVKNSGNNTTVGKGVNDLRKEEEEKNQSYQVKQVNNIIDQLEKVSVKDDTYTAGEFCTEDLEDDVFYTDDDLDDIYDSASGDSGARLPPEPRFGNVEYKLHLVSVCDARLRHLITQLKWRLVSGAGTAVYVIGARDCGRLVGLRPRALRASLRTLTLMADTLGATLSQVTARRVAKDRAVAELYIRKLSETSQCVELRVAVMGANEAGKSTLVGVLTQGELDNGRGSARLNMFRHVHEVRSGNTSSLGHEILGFDDKGNVVNYGCSELMTAERIGERSAKLVSFIDLAGHSKYQRTTVHGLTGYSPHCAMLLISATAGITPITEEHIGLLMALDLPFFTVITKCDLEPTSVPIIVEKLRDILKGYGKRPVLISDEESARTLANKRKTILDSLDEDSAEKETEDTVCVVVVSCVAGAGLNVLHAHLLALDVPAHTHTHQESCEFQIDEVFTIGEARVVAGYLASGTLCEGDTVLCGPTQSGEFVPSTVRSIHRNRVKEWRLVSGQCGCVALQASTTLRPGMVLLATASASKPKTEKKKFRRKDSNIIQEVSQSLIKNNNLNPNICSNDETPTKTITIQPKNKAKKNKKKSNNEDALNDNGVGFNDNGDNEVACTCNEPVREEDPNDPRGCYYFQADIELLRHSAEHIYTGFQCSVYIGNVRQTAIVEGILSDTGTLTLNSPASCILRFIQYPEWVRRGRRVLLRCGQTTRASGRVTATFPHYHQ